MLVGKLDYNGTLTCLVAAAPRRTAVENCKARSCCCTLEVVAKLCLASAEDTGSSRTTYLQVFSKDKNDYDLFETNGETAGLVTIGGLSSKNE